jgi:hypothetical protein
MGADTAAALVLAHVSATGAADLFGCAPRLQAGIFAASAQVWSWARSVGAGTSAITLLLGDQLKSSGTADLRD